MDPIGNLAHLMLINAKTTMLLSHEKGKQNRWRGSPFGNSISS